MMKKPRCEPTCPPHRTTFCPVCEHAEPGALGRVRIMGAIGVVHSSSPKIEKFWETGDPSVFD